MEKYAMNSLHDGGMKEQQCESMEINPVDHEKRFARLVAAEIAASLQVGYPDRDIVVKLLSTSLERQLCKRNGLLEQYLHTHLDILARTVKDRLELNEGLEVNYNYATHAKFADILDAFEAKYKPEQEFGTI